MRVCFYVKRARKPGTGIHGLISESGTSMALCAREVAIESASSASSTKQLLTIAPRRSLTLPVGPGLAQLRAAFFGNRGALL